MRESLELQLQEFGLPETEAQIYLCLLRNGALGASTLASSAGITRSSVYPVLESLVGRGLVEASAGYGSRYSAVPPERALPLLIARERESLDRREKLAAKLAESLANVAEPAEAGPEDMIQIIRSARGVAERFERLQLEAEEQFDCFVKAPMLHRSGNPTQQTLFRRGVKIRGLYERAVLDAPTIQPHLARWLRQGEEARIYEGELPHKLAISDRRRVLVHLTMQGDQMRTIYIQHVELARSLGMLFDSLWESATPIAAVDESSGALLEEKKSHPQGAATGTAVAHAPDRTDRRRRS